MANAKVISRVSKSTSSGKKKRSLMTRAASRTSGDVVVRARISDKIKKEAGKVLHDIGLSSSDAIRLLMVEIAEKGAMPFNVTHPNAVSRAAIRDADVGRVVRHKTVKSLMDDLNA